MLNTQTRFYISPGEADQNGSHMGVGGGGGEGEGHKRKSDK